MCKIEELILHKFVFFFCHEPDTVYPEQVVAIQQWYSISIQETVCIEKLTVMDVSTILSPGRNFSDKIMFLLHGINTGCEVFI